ncbi:MAG TPA: hypothetical protein VFS24_01025 [Steroidobacteraceae bacterium]|nr:hypothetical protein [Steroidobacteraceae bacterium]
MKLRYLTAAGLLCWLLVACQTINLNAPKSFNAKLQDGYTAVTAVVTTASTLYAAGKLSDADKANLVQMAQTAKDGLDIARQVHSTDPQAGDDRLAAVIAGLTALQNYLLTRNPS